MVDRSQLDALGLSAGIVALATGSHPHPAFEYRCQPAYEFDVIEEEERPARLVPLWECGSTLVACRPTVEGLQFVQWNVEDDEPLEVIARSEQGLFFWLFSFLIEDADWNDEEAALARLRAAADAVGFRHFDRINAFQQERSGESTYLELLSTEAQSFPA